jgi:hypothetical protein
MADFVLWAMACETALWPAGTFARAYAANRSAAVDRIIDADPVTDAVRAIMSDRITWTGTASDLLRAAADLAGDDVAPGAPAGRISRGSSWQYSYILVPHDQPKGVLSMPTRGQRVSPALKHGAYSEATLLPGEDPAEFKELHRDLIAEFTPNGRIEEETVATIARLMWRRQNLARFEIGQLSYFLAEGFKKAALAEASKNANESQERRNSKDDDELIAEFEELIEADKRVAKAEGARKGEAEAEWFEITKAAALTRLMKELDVEERLDAMIDKSIKRLLFVRGLKSITSSAATESSPTPRKGVRRVRASSRSRGVQRS